MQQLKIEAIISNSISKNIEILNSWGLCPEGRLTREDGGECFAPSILFSLLLPMHERPRRALLLNW